ARAGDQHVVGGVVQEPLFAGDRLAQPALHAVSVDRTADLAGHGVADAGLAGVVAGAVAERQVAAADGAPQLGDRIELSRAGQAATPVRRERGIGGHWLSRRTGAFGRVPAAA